MNALNPFGLSRIVRLVCRLAAPSGIAQQIQTRLETQPPEEHSPERDGQHDFDFEIGTWKTHLTRLLHPLTGSTTWVEYDGTSVARKIWDGRANLVELETDGPTRDTSKV